MNSDEPDGMTAGMVTASCLVCSALPMLAALACAVLWLVERIP